MKSKKYFLVLLALLLWLLYKLFSDSTDNNAIGFLTTNLLLDLTIFCVYILILIRRNRFLFPSALFIYFFYAYMALGKYVWLYRESNWFNESGDPKEAAVYFSIIGLILILMSIFNLSNSDRNVSYIKIDQINTLFVSKRSLFILSGITLFGAFLFTNGFKTIPFFGSAMDESRVALVTQDSGGRGIGFFCLLFGILSNSLALFSLKKVNKASKNIYWGFIIFNSFLLALYSGRFLPVMPFMVYFILSQYRKEIKFTKLFGIVLAIITSFLVLTYFGAVRQFGSDVTDELIVRYLIADAFPEFRMTVYMHSLSHQNLFESFFLTIVSGILPGFAFSILGINKAEYFRPIGLEILNMTQFDPSKTPGIRTSLFGELSMTGDFMYIFIVLLCFIFYKLDKVFLRNRRFDFQAYKMLSLAIFLGFSIPYGSLFLVSVIEWYFVLLLIEKYFLNEKK